MKAELSAQMVNLEHLEALQKKMNKATADAGGKAQLTETETLLVSLTPHQSRCLLFPSCPQHNLIVRNGSELRDCLCSQARMTRRNLQ